MHKKEISKLLAEFLGLSQKHVEQRVMKRPDFPTAYVVGAQMFWKKRDFEKWFESRKLK